MTLQEYLRALREQWLVILLAVLVGFGVSAFLHVQRPVEYTASVSLYVSSQIGGTPQAAYQGAQLSSQVVKTYTSLVSSSRVTNEVARRLRLPPTESLAGRVTAESDLDTVVIDVQARDASPEGAARIADTVGRVFAELVDELEQPSDPALDAPVAIRVIEPAAVPRSPSSPGLTRSVLPGLVIGLVVGIGVALLRNLLDTRIKSPQQLEALAGLPNLGTISYDSRVPRRPLTVHEDPRSPRSEAFRQLRTNLQFVDVDDPPTVVAITSAVPSEGKSTTLANLAITLASTGMKVLVIEADLRRPGLSDLFGLDRAVGLTSVLAGRSELPETIQRWEAGGFDVLASGPLPPNPSELLASQQMRSVLDSVRASHDIVLIDTPPLLPVTDAAAIAPACDGTLLVCRSRKTSRSQVDTAVRALASVSAHVLGTIFTFAPTRGPRAYQQYTQYYGPDQPAGRGPVGESPAEDSPAEDSPARDAPVQDAPVQDVSAQDVSAQDGPARNGAARNGAVQNGAVQNGAARSGPAPAVPAPSADAVSATDALPRHVPAAREGAPAAGPEPAPTAPPVAEVPPAVFAPKVFPPSPWPRSGPRPAPPDDDAPAELRTSAPVSGSSSG